MASEAEIAAAKHYMKIDGAEDDLIVALCYDAAVSYITDAGGVKRGTGDATFDLAVNALTLHYYDHRDAIAEQSVPSGFDRLLGQLKHRGGRL